MDKKEILTMIMDDTKKKHVRYLRENKCNVNGCFNYQETGVIYCIHHLHGMPRKFSNEEIIMYKQTLDYCVCENSSMDRNGNCRECGNEILMWQKVNYVYNSNIQRKVR